MPVIGFDANKALLCVIDSGYRFLHCNADDRNIENVGSVLQMKVDSTSLKKLTFLDLLLLHDPFPYKTIENQRVQPKVIEKSWRQMEQLVDAGRVRSLGLSNFSRDQIDRLTKFCNIKPVVLQIDSSILTLDRELKDYAHSFGIQVMVNDTNSNLTPVYVNKVLISLFLLRFYRQLFIKLKMNFVGPLVGSDELRCLSYYLLL
ncbi:unnamed protein product [Hymenolepis diminuta]|uniref:NADP-dependent oxidoreductase domain-containing protein n=1 Tax=Hymenolepis diminuta TaxID=6216 RepID=A0A564YM45_HYMDI|nr:unnamed protein product [Hymenolepis diminuta]